MRKSSFLSGSMVAPLLLWAACGGGGGGGGDPTGVDDNELSSAPLVGQFLAECPDATATIDGFVAQSPLAGEAEDLPASGDVLASGDPDTIEVIGGLVPAAGNPDDLEAISADEAMAMIPPSGLSGSLPVLGQAPVTCGDLPVLIGQLPDPTNAPGLVPVFDPDGDPVGVVLVTVGEAQATIESLGLPVGVDTLPEPFPATIAQLLVTLGPLMPTPTPTGSGAQPTPTPTPASGQICGGALNIPCPEGQVCVALPGQYGECQGI